MAVLSRKQLKRKLGTKLIYSPFIRLVLFNTWFQLAFGAMVLVGVFVALYLPKMWTTTPKDFLPVVKVSGLDMTQNWALKRNARKSLTATDYKRALQSWEAAVAQDPGDAESIRGYLNTCLKVEKADRAIYRSSVSQMTWLLRLGQTNAADVTLAAKVCEHFKWYEVGAYILGSVQSDLPAEAEATYLKSLFQLGRFREFQTRYTAAAKRLNDTALPLYELAFKAASQSNSAGAEAEKELERLSESGDHVDLAARLHMLACGQRGNVNGYARSLQKLSARNGDNLIDHATYWLLLAGNGRTEQARSLAESFTRAPASAVETVRVADAYFQLGMLESARELLERFAPSFYQSPEVWVAYAAVLEKLQDWAGMRQIALKIREDVNGRDTLWGYAYFLEGRAEIADKRESPALRAFTKASESTYEIPPLGASVARELTRLKKPELAMRIYEALEKSMSSERRFWNEYFEAAFAVQDAEKVLRTSAQAFKLDPDDVNLHNRYVAALIVNRKDPEELIKLSVQLVSRYPNSVAAKLNHSFALLFNGRTSEAQETLEKIDLAALSPMEANSYHLAKFEVDYNLQRWDAAAASMEKISNAPLFPEQRSWLEEKKKQISARLMAKNQNA